MRPTAKLTKKSNLPILEKQLKQIAKSEVYVGIPESNNDRPGEEIGNASLLFVHTNGSPLQSIPARPVLEPAVSQPRTKALIAKQLGAAAKAILEKDPESARDDLDKAGQIAENAAKSWFVSPDNGWAPNAPSTIAAKGSDRPLIDTGELRRAITHIVKTP